MSEATNKAQPESVLDDAAVAEYLQQHPDFLQQHPDTLATINIVHDSGSAASLIERQVGRLREENRRLQSRLTELLDAARNNEQRVTQVHNLARALVSAADAEQLVSALVQCVKREMNVDAVFVGIRGLPTQIGNGDATIRPLDDNSPAGRAVTHVFRRGKPLCDALTQAQNSALFTNIEPAPASAALVPLGVHGVHGALVLASTEADHFVPDMGTLFLTLIGELVTTALRRHLGTDVLP